MNEISNKQNGTLIVTLSESIKYLQTQVHVVVQFYPQFNFISLVLGYGYV